MKKFPILFTLIVSLLFVACSDTHSKEDLIKAIDSGNMDKVRNTISEHGTYSVMDSSINGRNILEYAQQKGGTAMANLIASTKFTESDKEIFTKKYIRNCLKTAGQKNENYCKCSGESIYNKITYLDLIDTTSHMRTVMQNAQRECQ